MLCVIITGVTLRTTQDVFSSDFPPGYQYLNVKMTKDKNLELWLPGEVGSRVSKFCYIQTVVAGRNDEGNYY